MNNQNILKVKRFAVDEDGNHIKTSRDGRRYITAYFQPQAPEGLLSNARARGRNIWEEGPNGSQGDAIFPALASANYNKENGELTSTLKVIGEVQTIEVEPYYIPNEYGKHIDPETNEPANKANNYTSVVFEDETIAQLARSQDHTLAGQAEAEALDEEEQEVPELAMD